jgi:hypothetical protein
MFIIVDMMEATLEDPGKLPRSQEPVEDHEASLLHNY